MDTSVQLSNDTHYVIPALTSEKQRLLQQYAFKKRSYGWTHAVPDYLDLTEVHDVLDIAAGSCAWTLDFADIPAVKSRLSRQNGGALEANKATAIRISICDIDTKFFPAKEVLDQIGVEAFEQDVTKPFREDLYGKFDLVHISMVALCLTQSSWTEALKNCYKLLRPGGMLMTDEIDPIIYTSLMPPPTEDAPGHDLDTCMGGNEWVHKANRIYTGWALHKGFIVDLTFRLPALLRDAGFDVVQSQRAVGRYGKLYDLDGLSGEGTLNFKAFTVENFIFIFDYFSAALMQARELEGEKGVKVTDETQRKLILQEIQDGFNTDGAMSLGRFFLAAKPKTK